MFKAGKNPSELTEEQLKAAAKSVVENEDISKIIKDARDDYASAKKSGEISGDEKIDLVDDDEEIF